MNPETLGRKIAALRKEQRLTQKVMDTLSTISIQEKQALVKELKRSAVLKIVIVLLATILYASKIFAAMKYTGLHSLVRSV